jgi:hypothetical protein
MDPLDHLAARITAAGGFGALAGVGIALFKGHRIPRTAGLTAFSCALCGTACFGSERLASASAQYFLGSSDEYQRLNHWETTLASHFIGGNLGGAIVGGLYTGKPARGVLFFTPLTVFFGFGDVLFQDMREERLQRILQKEKESERKENESLET